MRIIALLILLFPTIVLADQFKGKISKISVNENGTNIIFELVNKNNSACESGWFTANKPESQLISPAEFIVQAYFSKSPVKVHANEICAPKNSPSKVTRVSLGTSHERSKQLKRQWKDQRGQK